MKVFHYRSTSCLEPQIWTHTNLLEFSEAKANGGKELISERNRGLEIDGDQRKHATRSCCPRSRTTTLDFKIQTLKEATLIHQQ
jgi:hypothetical protein